MKTEKKYHVEFTPQESNEVFVSHVFWTDKEKAQRAANNLITHFGMKARVVEG